MFKCWFNYDNNRNDEIKSHTCAWLIYIWELVLPDSKQLNSWISHNIWSMANHSFIMIIIIIKDISMAQILLI